MSSVTAEQIRATVEARLRELAPALSEFEHLRGVLAILDNPEAGRRLIEASALPAINGISMSVLDGREPSAAPQGEVRRRLHTRIGEKQGVDGRAPQGANKQRILAVIAEHPGIAAPRVAKLTGLRRPVVASTISRLKKTGELRAYGEGVCLAKPTLVDSVPAAVDALGYVATGSG